MADEGRATIIHTPASSSLTVTVISGPAPAYSYTTDMLCGALLSSITFGISEKKGVSYRGRKRKMAHAGEK